MDGLEPAAAFCEDVIVLSSQLATILFDVISTLYFLQMKENLLLKALRPFPRPNAAEISRKFAVFIFCPSPSSFQWNFAMVWLVGSVDSNKKC